MHHNETPMTLEYWKRRGGLLIEEAQVVARSEYQQQRLVDALIYPNEPTRRARGDEVDWEQLVGAPLVVVQTKRSRLGTYLGGQGIFSRYLATLRFPDSSVESVVVCSADDSELRPLVESFGVQIVILGGFAAPVEKKAPVAALREQYWRTVGGTLVERFLIVDPTATSAAHYAEAIILPERDTRRAAPDEHLTIGHEPVIILSSNGGLGMYVTGHALLTAELLRRHHPTVTMVKSVAVVPRDDAVIRGLYDPFAHVERIVLSSVAV
jgi:hypothetical protein